LFNFVHQIRFAATQIIYFIPMTTSFVHPKWESNTLLYSWISLSAHINSVRCDTWWGDWSKCSFVRIYSKSDRTCKYANSFCLSTPWNTSIHIRTLKCIWSNRGTVKRGTVCRFELRWLWFRWDTNSPFIHLHSR